MLDYEGVQNTPPQNMLLVYFGLKAFDKLQIQKGLSDLPFFYLKAGRKTSPVKSALSAPGREHSYQQNWDFFFYSFFLFFFYFILINRTGI